MRIDNENKVVIPKILADYIEYAKQVDFDIEEALRSEGLFDDVLEFLYGNTEKVNEQNYLIAVRAWVEGYEIEQPKKYYWRKKKEYLAWFENFATTFLHGNLKGKLYLDGLMFALKATEQQARNLLRDDFDKFEKVECE